MGLLGERVYNAEKETLLCCIKMELYSIEKGWEHPEKLREEQEENKW